MLMTICGVFAAIVLLVVSFWKKWPWLRKFTLVSAAIWFAFFAVMLFGTSLLSEEKALALNEPKEFCGFYLDCHLHTSVTGVRITKTIGDRTANGEFYVVKVKVFSDAKQASLGLVAVEARVMGDNRLVFQRDAEAEAKLGEQPPFERRIAPAESFEKEIVFDLPADGNGAHLDIREGYGTDHCIEAVLIGDEDSILHKRTCFKLEA